MTYDEELIYRMICSTALGYHADRAHIIPDAYTWEQEYYWTGACADAHWLVNKRFHEDDYPITPTGWSSDRGPTFD